MRDKDKSAGAGFFGTDELLNKYKRDTPGESMYKKSINASTKNKKEDIDMKSAKEFLNDMFNEEVELDEALKAAKNAGPFTVVAIKNGKVIDTFRGAEHNELKDVVAFVKANNKGAKISVEAKGGKIIHTEDVEVDEGMVKVKLNPKKKIGYEIRSVGPGGKTTVTNRKDMPGKKDINDHAEMTEAKAKRITKLHGEYPKGTHLCATHVEHAEYGIGSTIKSQHATPDRFGDIDWYDVMFEHGIEHGVPTDVVDILLTEVHENHDHEDEVEMDEATFDSKKSAEEIRLRTKYRMSKDGGKDGKPYSPEDMHNAMDSLQRKKATTSGKRRLGSGHPSNNPVKLKVGESVELDEGKMKEFLMDVQDGLEQAMDKNWYRELDSANGGQALINIVNHVAKNEGKFDVKKTIAGVLKRYGKTHKEYMKLSMDIASRNKFVESVELDELTVPEKHQVHIAKKTLNTPDAAVRWMGGMTKDDARKILKKHKVRFKESVDEKVERPMGLSGKFSAKGMKGLFAKSQLDQLRVAYKKIGKINPESNSYKKLIDYLNSLKIDQLKQLVDAKIPFMSSLAFNRFNRMQNPKNYPSGKLGEAKLTEPKPNPNFPDIDFDEYEDMRGKKKVAAKAKPTQTARPIQVKLKKAVHAAESVDELDEAHMMGKTVIVAGQQGKVVKFIGSEYGTEKYKVKLEDGSVITASSIEMEMASESYELDEAWTADSVIRNAEIGSKKGYGIIIKKGLGVTKTPYKHMLMTMRRDKSVRVTFDHGKDEFEGTPKSVALYVNKILGIKESVELDEAKAGDVEFTYPTTGQAKAFSNTLVMGGVEGVVVKREKTVIFNISDLNKADKMGKKTLADLVQTARSNKAKIKSHGFTVESVELDERTTGPTRVAVDKEFTKMVRSGKMDTGYAIKHVEKMFKIKNVKVQKDKNGKTHVISFNESVELDEKFDLARRALVDAGIPHMGERKTNKLKVHPKFKSKAQDAMKKFKGVDLEINHRMPEKPMTREDVERVDELDAKTLIRYNNKASAQVTTDMKTDRGRVTPKTNKRFKGVLKARKKLDKIMPGLRQEDAEQVDELKKDTLLKYKEKAQQDKNTIARMNQSTRGPLVGRDRKDFRNRTKGIDSATKRLVSRQYDEEVLDEVKNLSSGAKGMLSSAINASSKGGHPAAEPSNLHYFKKPAHKAAMSFLSKQKINKQHKSSHDELKKHFDEATVFDPITKGFESVDELDEARRDVHVIVDKNGMVVANKMDKNTAKKAIDSMNKRGKNSPYTIVLAPDANVGAVLKKFVRKESVEQVDELDTKTLKSYKDKARKDHSVAYHKDRDFDRTEKRKRGFTKAMNRIIKNDSVEEVEHGGKTVSTLTQSFDRGYNRLKDKPKGHFSGTIGDKPKLTGPMRGDTRTPAQRKRDMNK